MYVYPLKQAMDKYLSDDTQLVTKIKNVKDMDALDVLICPISKFDLGNAKIQ